MNQREGFRARILDIRRKRGVTAEEIGPYLDILEMAESQSLPSPSARDGKESEFHDRVTQHLNRVAEYVQLLALRSGLSTEAAFLIKQASVLHDIGKVAIPDSILSKPSQLTKEEYEVMKSHTQIGFEILRASDTNIHRIGGMVAYQHQEKYDGTGYPHNLKGKEIHLFSRITTVVDVFDALGSERCYKEPWNMERIVDYLKSQKGRHFDPDLIDILLANLDDFLRVKKTFGLGNKPALVQNDVLE